MGNFTVERPLAWHGLLLLIPVILITIFQYRKISKHMKFYNYKKNFNGGKDFHINHFCRIIVLRTIFRCLAWTMLVLAYAGFSWGTYLEPVQKNGNAVSMVFDISYSMMARDGMDKNSRLDSSINYARLLLSKMENFNISVVVAKGDGVVVVPLTEDKIIVEGLLDSLSPRLMSSIGTSLGNGVTTALKSFPESSAFANRIWLFTDGEETDGQLEKALTNCLKSGVSVTIIGFGKEYETSAVAGDGKTIIRTALRSERMRNICQSVVEKNPDNKKNGVSIEYIDSTEPGSALQLLKPLKTVSASVEGGETSSSITYEMKPVSRYSIFLVAAFILFVLSFFISEFNTEIFSRKKALAVTMIFVSGLFTGCGGRFEGAKQVLISSWNWSHNHYNEAVAGFFQTAVEAQENEDFDLNQYALYGLATTYLMQNENKAAVERFSQISDEAPDQILYATYYNLGVIAHKNGEYEQAAKYFKEALKKDSSKTDAKINLELSLLKSGSDSKSNQKILKSVSENKEDTSKENSLFNVIREYEKQQWTNSEETQNSNTAEDY